MPFRRQATQRPFVKALLGTGISIFLIAGILFGSIQFYHRSLIQQHEVKVLYEILNRQIILAKEAGLLAQKLETPPGPGENNNDVLHHDLLHLANEINQERERLDLWMERSSTAEDLEDVRSTISASTLQPLLEELEEFSEKLARASSLRTRESIEGLNFLTQDAQVALTDMLTFLSSKAEHEYRVLSQVLMKRVYWFTIPVVIILLITWLLIFRPLHSALRGRNDRLSEAVLRAEAATRSKIEFLANVSHEIRTPMTAILGYLDLVQQDKSVSAKSLQHLDIIDRNARHLLRLIDEILDVSKADAGKLQLNPSEISLDEILFDIYSLLKIKAYERGVELIIRYEGPVPTTIYTDPVRLKQVLFNIVGNAVKFTSQGYVKVTVSMETKRRRLLLFDVEDTGKGIPKAHFSKLFKPFEQVDSSSTRTSTGTGLGLVLSKKIAEKLGGNLTLEKSVPGVGTKFRIAIAGGRPAQETASVREFPHNALANNSSTRIGATRLSLLEGKRVLIVDDVAENGYLFQVYLEHAHALPDFATSGQEALDIVKKQGFDLILLDLQMPGMDGFTTLERLRAAGVDCPIFALTAHAMDEEKERALAAGFTDFITKPIRSREFLSILEEYFKTAENPPFPESRLSFS